MMCYVSMFFLLIVSLFFSFTAKNVHNGTVNKSIV